MLKLSVSSIGSYEKCPKKYHYRYIEKPEIEQVDWVHLEFGSCAHKVLELFHLELMARKRPFEELPALMTQCFKTGIKEFNKKLLTPAFPELQNVLQQYLNTLKENGIPETLGIEIPFEFELKHNESVFQMRGFIDRLDKIGPGEYEVVDYKTSKNADFLTDFQLLVYALVVKIKYPDAKIIHGSYVMLKHKSYKESWEFREPDLEECRKHIIDVGLQIESDTRWVKMPSRLCDWCDYKKICQETWT